MNLYVHFPFCRAKCRYCALPSFSGSSSELRRSYVANLVRALAERPGTFRTVYFGGGTPALCALVPLVAALAPRLAPAAEFTVELHPLDVRADLLSELRAHGVNRVSLGAQSFDDSVLAAMGRGCRADEIESAFSAVRAAGFVNAGLDLIAGYPGADDSSWLRTLRRAAALSPSHVSVYTLIREPGTSLDLAAKRGRVRLPSDDTALAQMSRAVEVLAAAGLARYEISNFARPGMECRHNFAVWRGEDYVGLGSGARGREGRARTEGGLDVGGEWRAGRVAADGSWRVAREELDEFDDAFERTAFSLRTSDGFSPSAAARRWPSLAPHADSWRGKLSALAAHGIVRADAERFVLTPRGMEVCDAVVAELVP